MKKEISLSVIIPTRNRLNVLKGLLASFQRHISTDFEWEILIIDNMSEDGTYDFLQNANNQYNFNLRYVREKNLGLHYCRHRGAIEAKGSIIAYLDDDMLVSEKWLLGCRLIINNQADMVVGRILPKWESVPPLWIDYFYINGRSDFLGLLDFGVAVKPINVVFGGNFFIKKEILFELGGFGPDGFPKEFNIFRGNGEGKLWRRFVSNGYRSYYDPISTVLHIIDSSRLTKTNFSKKVYNAEISRYIYSLREKFGIEKKIKFSLSNKLRGRLNYFLLKYKQKKIYYKLNDEDKSIIDKIYYEGKQNAELSIKKINSTSAIKEWLLKDNFLDFDFELLKGLRGK